ncbi:MAG: 3-dehydroquinate synthase [Burkholderiaceae bacterium]|nr:3-dehydroquinate synthase [Burkholderiaceae bacterium]
MRSLSVGLGDRTYSIHIGSGLLDRVAEFVAPLAPTSVLVVTNEIVGPLYGRRLVTALETLTRTSMIELPDGEHTKRWDSVAAVLDVLVARGADRKSLVVALGGGVIGDLAGFAASIYMRGIRFVQVPTTLLAQVDSSVGGKTGINHPSGKNLIGTFHQPSVVVADTDTLQSLPSRELAAGLAEILKHGLLADAAYFEQVVGDLALLRGRDPAALAQAIERSCEIKAAVVGRDERESGERALLNLGHTFGHAIEALSGYGEWLHGEAVGCGMVIAADLSRRVGLLDDRAVRSVEHAVALAGLPPRIEGLGADAAISSMRGDKKAEAGAVRYILLERIGRATQRAVPDDLVRASLLAGGFR